MATWWAVIWFTFCSPLVGKVPLANYLSASLSECRYTVLKDHTYIIKTISYHVTWAISFYSSVVVIVDQTGSLRVVKLEVLINWRCLWRQTQMSQCDCCSGRLETELFVCFLSLNFYIVQKWCVEGVKFFLCLFYNHSYNRPVYWA